MDERSTNANGRVNHEQKIYPRTEAAHLREWERTGNGIEVSQEHQIHPMTQGTIERYHRSMNNILLLENHYSPDERKDQIDVFGDYYNTHHYHEALNNLTPADVYYGGECKILRRREKNKNNTMRQRRRYKCSFMVA